MNKVKYFCKRCNQHKGLVSSHLVGKFKDETNITLDCGHKFNQKL